MQRKAKRLTTLIYKVRRGGLRPRSHLSKDKSRAKTKRSRLKLHTLHWAQLNEKQKVRRRKSLTVLDQMRNGVSFSAACRQQEVSRATVRRYLDGVLYRKNNRVKSRSKDALFRNVEIHTHSKTIFIETNDSEEASRVSKYHSAIKLYLEQGNVVPLMNFKGSGVRDSNGNFYFFETNLKTIIELNEMREDEFYDIYEG